MAQNKNIGQLAAMGATDAANAAHQMLIRDPSQGTASNRTKSIRLDVLRGADARLQGIYDVSDPYFGNLDTTGATDGLSNLNNALSAAAAKGGIIRIPIATVGLSNFPTIPGGVQIRIIGMGAALSKLKHLTGGKVISWIGTHLVGEFGCSIEDLTLDGNNTSQTVSRFQDCTFFMRRRLIIRNGNGALGAGSGSGTGLEWVSMWDSASERTYVTDCGGGASPCVLFDTMGSGNDTLNNNQEYDLHIEPTDRDCDYLEIRGNASNEVGDNYWAGLKIHGNSSTGNPGAGHYLLKMSQYAKFNHVDRAIFGFGKGTAQVFIDGQRNTIDAATCGVGGAFPTYAFQFGGNSADNTLWSPNVKTPSLYGTPNVCFRFDLGSVHNKVVFPVGNYGSAAPFADAARNLVWWDDLGSNVGLELYNSDGIATIAPGFVQTQNYVQPITYNALLAVNAGNSNHQRVTLTGNTVVQTPTNPTAGQILTLTFIQDGTGGRTVGFNASFKVVWSDTGNTLNKQSSITVWYDGSLWQLYSPQTPYV